MGHTTKKQWEYANKIADKLGIEMPKTNDFDTVNQFIQDHRQQFYQAQNRDLAREINDKIAITDYASMLGFTLKRAGSRYFSLKEHDSVIIDPDKNIFYRNSIGGNGRAAYGGDVIEFAIHFAGKSYAEAMQELQGMINSNALPERKIDRTTSLEKEEKELKLPEAAYDMRRVFAYLTKTRGIYQEVVQDFVDRKMLYQDSGYGNCVFVSREDDGTPVFACKRGTNSDPNKRFVGDVNGCNYEKGFFVNNDADKLIVTESVIDAMSVMTILYAKGEDFKDYNYIALAGSSKYSCVANQIKDHMVSDIYLALDNDASGKENTEKIKEMLEKEFGNELLQHESFPQHEKDWNAELSYAAKHGMSYRELDFFQTVNDSSDKKLNKTRAAYAYSMDMDDGLEL